MRDQFSAFEENSGSVGFVSVQPPGPKGYEFSTSENQLLRDLAHKLSGVGCFATAIGLLYGVVGLFLILATWMFSRSSDPFASGFLSFVVFFLAVLFGVATLVFLFSGVWMRRSSGGFMNAADTPGHDIAHVMAACGQLTKLYRLWGLLLGFALFLTLMNFWQMAKLLR